MAQQLADIRAHVSVASDVLRGIKVRGKISGMREDPEDASQIVVEIQVPSKGKKKESGYEAPSSFSYSVPKRLMKDLCIGDRVVVRLTPG